MSADDDIVPDESRIERLLARGWSVAGFAPHPEGGYCVLLQNANRLKVVVLDESDRDDLLETVQVSDVN